MQPGTTGSATTDPSCPRRQPLAAPPRSWPPGHPEQRPRRAADRRLVEDLPAGAERRPEAIHRAVVENVLAGREERPDHRVVLRHELDDELRSEPGEERRDPAERH